MFCSLEPQPLLPVLVSAFSALEAFHAFLRAVQDMSFFCLFPCDLILSKTLFVINRSNTISATKRRCSNVDLYEDDAHPNTTLFPAKALIAICNLSTREKKPFLSPFR